MKNISKKLILVIIGIAACLPINANFYDGIRYSNAFNQAKIYTKYQKLLEKLNCYKNVCPEAQEQTDDIEMTNQSFSITIADEEGSLLNSNKDTLDQDLKNYEAECQKLLDKARFMALAEPGIYTALEMSLIAGAALGTAHAVGTDSMGGSFAVYGSLTNSLLRLPDLIKTGYRLCSRPDNCMKALEDCYAKNKCFIPNQLWKKIEKAFVEARQNAFAREKNVQFLNMALSITPYKPKPSLTVKEGETIASIKNELNHRIDNFFKDYELKDQGQSLFFIKINVSKFIDTLINKKATSPRYIYLHGLGGIGKTHFVQTLAQWINELIPHSIIFEELVIHSAQELEGAADNPGAFLRVLQQQLTQQKHGSIVMFDEATWLNEPHMISSAKRTFNGNHATVPTKYFGSDEQGDILKLELPPMLIFVASNNPINDTALASRFDIIQYPTPTLHALSEYAYQIATRSNELKKHGYTTLNKDTISEFIKNLEPKNQNFRQIGADIEVHLLAHQSQN